MICQIIHPSVSPQAVLHILKLSGTGECADQEWIRILHLFRQPRQAVSPVLTDVFHIFHNNIPCTICAFLTHIFLFSVHLSALVFNLMQSYHRKGDKRETNVSCYLACIAGAFCICCSLTGSCPPCIWPARARQRFDAPAFPVISSLIPSVACIFSDSLSVSF